MKITTTLLCFVFLCAGVQAQPQQSEDSRILNVADKELGFPRLERVESGGKIFFKIRYCDMRYNQARVTRSIEFSDVPGQLESVYKFFKAQFQSTYPASMELGEEKITAAVQGDMLQVDVIDKRGKKSVFALSEEQLDQLFKKP